VAVFSKDSAIAIARNKIYTGKPFAGYEAMNTLSDARTGICSKAKL
jgi:hypothetical protein